MRSITLDELLADDGKPRRMPTADDARHLSALLQERANRNSPNRAARTVAQVLDNWLDHLEAFAGNRWPVIRSGERDPIPWMLRLSIYRRDDFTCRQCGDAFDQPWGMEYLELDHCIPWSAGGPDDSDNLRTLCRHCNQRRSNYIDHAHATNYRPTTWWCNECWTEEGQRGYRPFWKDGTDLNTAPLVGGDESSEWVLAYCAWCRFHSFTDRLLIGEAGRELMATATRFAA